MIFRMRIKFCIYIVVIRLIHFFCHFCSVSHRFHHGQILLSSKVIRVVPTEFCSHKLIIS